MGTRSYLWLYTKKLAGGAVVGAFISSRVGLSYVQGGSMRPTLEGGSTSFPGSLGGDIIFVEKFCLANYKFRQGDVITIKDPFNHKRLLVKRLIALPGQRLKPPGRSQELKIPDGHCWVEGDNSAGSFDSKSFGPVPLGLIRGRATHVIWPPHRIGVVERQIPAGRIAQH